MKNNKIKRAVAIAAAAITVTLGGCASQADVVNENLDTAAENFQLLRRVVFVNTITDAYLLEIQGYCNITPLSGRVMVECRTGPDDDEFVRHTIYSGDNTAVVVEQLEAADVDPFHYRFIIRPETILPDIEIQTSNP